MFVVAICSPSIIRYDYIFYWTVIIEPCQDIGTIPIASPSDHKSSGRYVLISSSSSGRAFNRTYSWVV
ncbi:hypothetical protein DERP_011332 [Dermatophagoides pteronyssinus]|uniref:Uncharacterized protein n=1 Tax=Dermatophagoides pteronyssinus TaxID=6956 RepID=A0ABQ8J7S7_DERPT|nr:hypothetical protein DERP_011332 [Dermatophagoides pteronyssinus]